MLKGKYLNGKMLLQLAEAYTTALNANQVPAIDTAWNYVQNAEFERAFTESLSTYGSALKKEWADRASQGHLPVAVSELKATFKDAKEKMIIAFEAEVLQGQQGEKHYREKCRTYIDKLKKEFKRTAEEILGANEEALKKAVTNALNTQISDKIRKPMRSESLTLNELNLTISEIRTTLKSEYEGLSANLDFIDGKILEATLPLMQDIAGNQSQVTINQLRVAEKRADDFEEDLREIKDEFDSQKGDLVDRDRQKEQHIIQIETENRFLKDKLERTQAVTPNNQSLKDLQNQLVQAQQKVREQRVSVDLSQSQFQGEEVQVLRHELEQLSEKYARKDSELLLAQQELKQRLRKDSHSPATIVKECSPSKITVSNSMASKHFYA